MPGRLGRARGGRRRATHRGRRCWPAAAVRGRVPAGVRQRVRAGLRPVGQPVGRRGHRPGRLCGRPPPVGPHRRLRRPGCLGAPGGRQPGRLGGAPAAGGGPRLVRLAGRRQQQPFAALPGEDGDFWRAVRRLPRRQAQVVALVALEDLSTAQVASTLGCSQRTVQVHLQKARVTLAVRLGLPAEEETDDAGSPHAPGGRVGAPLHRRRGRPGGDAVAAAGRSAAARCRPPRSRWPWSPGWWPPSCWWPGRRASLR